MTGTPSAWRLAVLAIHFSPVAVVAVPPEDLTEDLKVIRAELDLLLLHEQEKAPESQSLRTKLLLQFQNHLLEKHVWPTRENKDKLDALYALYKEVLDKYGLLDSGEHRHSDVRRYFGKQTMADAVKQFKDSFSPLLQKLADRDPDKHKKTKSNLRLELTRAVEDFKKVKDLENAQTAINDFLDVVTLWMAGWDNKDLQPEDLKLDLAAIEEIVVYFEGDNRSQDAGRLTQKVLEFANRVASICLDSVKNTAEARIATLERLNSYLDAMRKSRIFKDDTLHTEMRKYFSYIPRLPARESMTMKPPEMEQDTLKEVTEARLVSVRHFDSKSKESFPKLSIPKEQAQGYNSYLLPETFVTLEYELVPTNLKAFVCITKNKGGEEVKPVLPKEVFLNRVFISIGGIGYLVDELPWSKYRLVQRLKDYFDKKFVSESSVDKRRKIQSIEDLLKRSELLQNLERRDASLEDKEKAIRAGIQAFLTQQSKGDGHRNDLLSLLPSRDLRGLFGDELLWRKDEEGERFPKESLLATLREFGIPQFDFASRFFLHDDYESDDTLGRVELITVIVMKNR